VLGLDADFARVLGVFSQVRPLITTLSRDDYTLCSPICSATPTFRAPKTIRGGWEFLASARRDELGRGAMNKVTRELVVRGSAAAAGLVVLVSVVGAGVKWGN